MEVEFCPIIKEESFIRNSLLYYLFFNIKNFQHKKVFIMYILYVPSFITFKLVFVAIVDSYLTLQFSKKGFLVLLLM